MPFIAEIALLLFLFVLGGIALVGVVALLAFVIGGIVGRSKKKKDKSDGNSTLVDNPDPSSS